MVHIRILDNIIVHIIVLDNIIVHSPGHHYGTQSWTISQYSTVPWTTSHYSLRQHHGKHLCLSQHHGTHQCLGYHGIHICLGQHFGTKSVQDNIMLHISVLDNIMVHISVLDNIMVHISDLDKIMVHFRCSCLRQHQTTYRWPGQYQGRLQMFVSWRNTNIRGLLITNIISTNIIIYNLYHCCYMCTPFTRKPFYVLSYVILLSCVVQMPLMPSRKMSEDSTVFLWHRPRLTRAATHRGGDWYLW